MYARTIRVGLVLVALAATLAVNTRVFAQANGMDPFLGKWAMDRAQSTFTGAVPEWRNMTFEKAGANFRHVTETMQGEVVYKIQYTFNLDGKDYPADPAMAANTVSLKRVDATTIERLGKYQGSVGETVTYKLSADGKTLTVESHVTQNGADISSTQIFKKQ